MGGWDELPRGLKRSRNTEAAAPSSVSGPMEFGHQDDVEHELDPVLRSQLSVQRSFLEQALRGPPVDAPPPEFHRELCAGVPLEAAQKLLQPPPGQAPLRQAMVDVSPATTCLATVIRLFAELVPGKINVSSAHSLPFISAEQDLIEAAWRLGLVTQFVHTGSETLRAMAAGRPAACFVFLEAYVGVIKNVATGEENETEVGQNCVVIVGGDLLGPNYVIFDPWGPHGGEVSYWSEHTLVASSPRRFVEVSLVITN